MVTLFGYRGKTSENPLGIWLAMNADDLGHFETVEEAKLAANIQHDTHKIIEVDPLKLRLHATGVTSLDLQTVVWTAETYEEAAE